MTIEMPVLTNGLRNRRNRRIPNRRLPMMIGERQCRPLEQTEGMGGTCAAKNPVSVSSQY
jgi:hypothetical protein